MWCQAFYKSNVVDRFKNENIKILLEYLLPNISYISNNYHSETAFNNAKLFFKPASKIKGEDFFVGERGSTKFQISEIKTEYRSIIKTSRRNLLPNEIYDNRIELPLFRGVFITCEIRLNIEKPIRIYTKNSSNYYVDKELKEVKTSNENFNNNFNVLSYLEKDASKILQHNFLEQLLYIKEVFTTNIYISIFPTSVNFAIDTTTNFFDPQLNKKIDLNQVERIYQEIINCLMIVDVIDELNNNNKRGIANNVKKITS